MRSTFNVTTPFPNNNPFPVTEDEIKKFHKSFKKLDEDKSGDLDPSEIFSVPGNLNCLFNC